MGFLKTFTYRLQCTILLLVFCHCFANRSEKESSISLFFDINRTINLEDFKIFLNCTVNVASYFNFKRSHSCQKYPVALLITTFRGYNSGPNEESLTCHSNQPIFLKIDEEKEFIKEQYLQTHWTRTFTNFTEPKTYNYKLHVVPYGKRFTDTVRYTVFNRDFPTKNIQILWFQSYVSNEEEESKIGVVLTDAFKRPIVAKEEVVGIPCVFRQPETAILFKIEKKIDENPIILQIDNTSLSYHPTEGFKLNTNLFASWRGMFYCGDRDRQYKTRPFIITGLDSISRTTEVFHLETNPTDLSIPFYLENASDKNYTYIQYDIGSQFLLTCSSTVSNVTFEALNEKDAEVKEVYQDVSLNVTHTQTVKPVISHNAKILKFIIPPRLNEMLVNCLDPSTRRIFHTWHFRKGLYKSDIKVIARKNIIHCFTNDLTNIQLRQVQCNDRFFCKQLAPLIFQSPGNLKQTQIVQNCNPDSTKSTCNSIETFSKGFFQCTGKNKELKDVTHQDTYIMGFDNKLYIGDVQPPDVAILKVENLNQNRSNHIIFYLPGNATFFCEAHSFYFENGIQWFLVYENGTQTLTPSENVTDIPLEAIHWQNIRRQSNLHLENSDVKQIVCAAPLQSILNESYSVQWKYMAINVTLKHSIAPTFRKSLTTKYFRVGDSNQFLKCHVDGLPEPEISWTFKGKKIEAPLTEKIGFHRKFLYFPIYNESFEGEYKCMATNNGGNKTKTFSVHTYTSTNIWSIIAIILSVLIIIPSAILMFRQLRSQIKNLLTEQEVNQFREGINAHDSNDNKMSPFSLPHDDKYELAKQEFKIDTKKVLGKGTFGIVYFGSITKNDCSVTAAFKSVLPDCDVEKFKSLLSELKIMIYLGEHENLIRLLGAYTKEIQIGIAYIAMEFCSLGSLQHQLRLIDENNRSASKLVTSNETQTGYGVCIRNVETLSQEQLDKLYNWSSQIANGMEYLASKHVIHSDLATRNILLNSKEVAKITDFGLSRQMYNYYNYVKEKGRHDPLPWKWMAIESLRTLTFSSQSDVWGYGITLWEIFSLGAVPYPGISWTPEFLEMLENGTRNPKPKLADSKVYSVMLSCWDIEPRDRPSFNSLKIFFQTLKTNRVENTNNIDEDPESYKYLEEIEMTTET